MGDPQELRRQAEMYHMAVTATRHEIDDFVNNLSREQLVTFGKLVASFANDQDNARLATYFYGGIQFLLKFRHNVCPTHGVNHDEEALQEMAEEAKESSEKSEKDKDLDRRLNVDQLIEELLEAGGNPLTNSFLEVIQNAPRNEPSTALELEMMNRYNLDDVWDGVGPDDPDRKFIGFQCKNCKMFYPSIPDRMIKAVDDCSGCHVKAAHG
jgi:hypothetical protein